MSKYTIIRTLILLSATFLETNTLAQEPSNSSEAKCMKVAENHKRIEIEVSSYDPNLPSIDTHIDLVSAWHLDFSSTIYGGFSGLEVMADGSLLAVSDQGVFAKIKVDKDSGEPSSIIDLSVMVSETSENNHITCSDSLASLGKLCDAEGMAIKDNKVYVSFERDHRVNVFPMGACEIPSLGKLLWKLPSNFNFGSNKYTVPDNEGAEALHFSKDGHLVVGYEGHIKVDGALHHPTLVAEGNNLKASLDGTLSFGDDFGLVGQTRSLSLYRHYSKLRKNEIIIHSSATMESAHYKLPSYLDNFEGIAEFKNKANETYFYIISDDNLERRNRLDYNQKTLLYLFKVNEIKSVGVK